MLTSKQKIVVFERDHYRCGYCRLTVEQDLPEDHPRRATVDHVIPRAKGGRNEMKNFITACRRCNGEKQAMSADVYRWFRRMLRLGHEREDLLAAIELVEQEAQPKRSADEERQIAAWAAAGVERVREKKRAGLIGKRRLHTAHQRRDPYEKVLGKAAKGTLMHLWLHGER